MMALTEDGMLDPELVKRRDAHYGINTEVCQCVTSQTSDIK